MRLILGGKADRPLRRVEAIPGERGRSYHIRILVNQKLGLTAKASPTWVTTGLSQQHSVKTSQEAVLIPTRFW